MEYRELTLKVPEEAFDLTVDRLFGSGISGIEIVEEGREVLFKVYLPGGVSIPEEFEKFVVSESKLEERDWNSEWRKTTAR